MARKLDAAFLDFATLGPQIDTSRLENVATIDYFDFTNTDELETRIRDRELLIVNKVKLNRAAIGAVSRLQLIALSATGSDNVDLEAAGSRGIAVTNIRDYCSVSVAQHVFAMVLGLNQHIGAYDGLVRSGAWSRGRSFALFDFPIRELNGRTLAVIGYGALGRAVAKVGEGLGMHVIVAQRPGTTGPPPAGRVSFDELLRRADVLSLHCPLNDATHHLLGADAFRQMKRSAIVINTARGALIDRVALAAALITGEIAGAGIDVLPEEPPPATEPLLQSGIPNLILTPHIAWAALESRQRALDQVAENVEAYLRGERLRRLV
jgi:glycerate dehydrogenase